MNKYEKLIEHIINDEEGKARALFHEIVVEKSRDIYESLMDEEQFGEQMGGNQVDGMMDEIQHDEEGLPEDEEMDAGDEPIDGDADADMGMDDMDANMDNMDGEQSDDDKIQDLATMFDELQAKFAELTGDMGGDMHAEPDADNMGGPSDMDADNMPADDGMDMMGADDDSMKMYEAEDDDADDKNDKKKEDAKKDEESMEESRNYRKSEIDLMREYVEKVSAPSNTEGGEVGKGGSVAVNKKSITDNMKNDMGGTNANIVKGGSEQNPDGKQYKAPSNEYTKGQGTLKGAERNVNQPGGNKGAQDWYNTKASAKKPEGSTTDGSMSVDKNSILKHIK
jgi:hypothetical protein